MRERQWQARISEQRTSGLSKLAFCRQHNLNPSNFHYWCKRLGRDAPVHRRGRPRKFARVEVIGESIGSAGIHIRFPLGLEIRAERYPEPRWMAEVMVAIGAGRLQ